MKFRIVFFYILVMLGGVFFSCAKIDTDFGSNVVSSANSYLWYDTTIYLTPVNYLFGSTDTTYLGSVARPVGVVANSAFGTTKAALFVQLKPGYFPYTFAKPSDSLFIDSVILGLGLSKISGDTNEAFKVNVYEITDQNFDTSQKAFPVKSQVFSKGALLGSTSVYYANLKDTFFGPNSENTVGQIRVPLNTSWGERFLRQDSAKPHAYYNDSAFNIFFRGFFVEAPNQVNSMWYLSLSGYTTFNIYYRYLNADGTLTSTIGNFVFNAAGASPVASDLNYNRSGSALQAAVDAQSSSSIFLDNPSSYATLSLPDLSQFSSKTVINRAQLILTVDSNYSSTIDKPTYLYADIPDTLSTVGGYTVLPYDLYPGLAYGPSLPLASTYPGVNYTSFDGLRSDSLGSYTLNITRTLGQMIKNTRLPRKLRLYAPTLVRYAPYTFLYSMSYPNYSTGAQQVVLQGQNGKANAAKLRIIYTLKK